MQQKVVVEHLYKVFGEHPEAALRLLEQGVAFLEAGYRTLQQVLDDPEYLPLAKTGSGCVDASAAGL
jgi:hypothetical protein